MNAKQIIHQYMLSATKKSNNKIQVKCQDVGSGKQVYSAIFEAYPAYGAHIEKVKSGINYKDFTLKFDAKWATDEFLDILLKIKSDVSLKVQDPTPPSTETPKFDDPTQPAPAYTTPGSGAFTTIAGTTGNNNKIFIIAGAAVLVLALVLVLVKRK